MSRECSQNFIQTLEELDGDEEQFEGAYFQEEFERYAHHNNYYRVLKRERDTLKNTSKVWFLPAMLMLYLHVLRLINYTEQMIEEIKEMQSSKSKFAKTKQKPKGVTPVGFTT